jgi:hypothetical protein
VGHALPLLEVDSYLDNGSYSAVLADGVFNNVADWVLEFQINTGGNGFGSYLLLDNVQITRHARARPAVRARPRAAGLGQPSSEPPGPQLPTWRSMRTASKPAS